MKTVVADASALVDYLLQIGGARAIGPTFRSADSDTHVPFLCDAEVMAGLFRALRQRVASEATIRSAIADYESYPLTRHEHTPYLASVWDLRENFSARDAFYLALSEYLDATLVTTDLPLAAAARTIRHLDVLST